MPKPIDIAIINGYVLPMGGAAPIADGVVTIADERITGVGPMGSIDISRARKVVDATNCAVMPGFVDAHTHLAPNVLTRGLFPRLSAHERLERLALVKEGLDYGAQYWASLCGLIEMVKSGITSFNEHFDAYRVTPQLQALREVPLRATLGYGLADSGTYSFLADYSNRTLESFSSLVQEHHNTRNGTLHIALAPHSPSTCSEDLYRRVREIATRLRLPIHTHLSEGPDEHRLVVDRHGATPVQWLARLGVLDTDVTAAACSLLDAHDIRALADTGTRVAHCPASNALLGAGTMPLRELLAAGVTVGLGSDGPAAQHTVDPFAAMRAGALVQHTARPDRAPLTAYELLDLATSGAAAAMHRINTGALEPGLAADVIVVDLDREHTVPAHDPVAAVVFGARPDDVRHTIVDGRVLMEDRALTTVDEVEVRARVREAAAQVMQGHAGSGTVTP